MRYLRLIIHNKSRGLPSSFVSDFDENRTLEIHGFHKRKRHHIYPCHQARSFKRKIKYRGISFWASGLPLDVSMLNLRDENLMFPLAPPFYVAEMCVFSLIL